MNETITGNIAKMRKALEDVRNALEEWNLLPGFDYAQYSSFCDIIDDALAIQSSDSDAPMPNESDAKAITSESDENLCLAKATPSVTDKGCKECNGMKCNDNPCYHREAWNVAERIVLGEIEPEKEEK